MGSVCSSSTEVNNSRVVGINNTNNIVVVPFLKNNHKEITKEEKKIEKQRISNSKLVEINRQFETILRFFDLPLHKNVFENVNSIIRFFDREDAREEVSMKLTKIVFDYYDKDKSRVLDSSELKQFCRDLLNLLGYSDKQEILNSTMESLQSIMKQHNTDCLTFELFWNSHIMKGDALDLERNTFKEENFCNRLSLDSLSKISSLKSRELKDEFVPFFTFFNYTPTGNLLRDINLFHSVLVEEEENEESKPKLFDIKEKNVVQKKLQSRLLRYIFEYYDFDDSGVIERDELESFMRDVQEVLCKGEELEDDISVLVEEMLDDCDDDGDGKISYHEIIPHLPTVFTRMREKQ
ncbi:hypothetical protein ABK040_002633 [Willaertia magna]